MAQDYEQKYTIIVPAYIGLAILVIGVIGIILSLY